MWDEQGCYLGLEDLISLDEVAIDDQHLSLDDLLPDEERVKFVKMVKSEKRTEHIRTTCSEVQRRIIMHRRDAIDKEKTSLERSCEAAPAPGKFAVPIRIIASDVGRKVIFRTGKQSFGRSWGCTVQEQLHGELESVNWRTIHPHDGSPSWKARIFSVRVTHESPNGSDTETLHGVHQTRILSMR